MATLGNLNEVTHDDIKAGKRVLSESNDRLTHATAATENGV